MALPAAPRTISLIALQHGREAAMGDAPPQPASFSKGMDENSGLPAALTAAGPGATVSTAPVHSPTARPNISGGVAAGLLITPIRPIYPAIARAAQIEGSVVVEAIISRAGTIESIYVVSGPEMLRQAAVDAIRVARYRPYRLSGEPTDVQTTITVNFRIGG